MRSVAAVFCLTLVVVTLTAGDDSAKTSPALKTAREQFNTSLSKVQADYNRAVAKLVEEHKKRLKELQDSQTKAGDLDAAVATRDDMKLLDEDGPPIFENGKESPTRKRKFPAGTWVIQHYPNYGARTYEIKANGQVNYVELKLTGKLQRSGDSFFLDLNDDKIERLTFVGDRVFTEHWNPKSDFGKNPAVVVGVGELRKK